jgi:hypothetical protein
MWCVGGEGSKVRREGGERRGEAEKRGKRARRREREEEVGPGPGSRS